MRELYKGDVVQIKPAYFIKNDAEPAAKCFWGCFAVVDKVKEWGIVADIIAPAHENKSTPPGLYPVRLPYGTFVYIGVSVFSINEVYDAI